MVFGSVNANRRHYEAAATALSRADHPWLEGLITRVGAPQSLVLSPTRVAMLDRRLTAAVGRVPELKTALMRRAVRRSRWLALHLAIRCLRRIDVRLLVLFWHLAERWGRVTREGIVLPLPFTHRLLGRLVGAQRPTVTTALGQLAEREVVRRRDGAWLLSSTLPAELERMDASSGVAEAQSSIFGGEGRPPAAAMSAD